MAWNLWEAFDAGQNQVLTKQKMEADTAKTNALIALQALQQKEGNRHNLVSEGQTDQQIKNSETRFNEQLQWDKEKFGEEKNQFQLGYDIKRKELQLDSDRVKNQAQQIMNSDKYNTGYLDYLNKTLENKKHQAPTPAQTIAAKKIGMKFDENNNLVPLGDINLPDEFRGDLKSTSKDFSFSPTDNFHLVPSVKKNQGVNQLSENVERERNMRITQNQESFNKYLQNNVVPFLKFVEDNPTSLEAQVQFTKQFGANDEMSKLYQVADESGLMNDKLKQTLDRINLKLAVLQAKSPYYQAWYKGTQQKEK